MANIKPMTTPPKSVDHYVARLPVLLVASGILLASAGLALALYLQTPEPVEGGPISDTAMLIVYEGDDCPPCEVFRETGGRAYRRGSIQAQAPLIYRPLEASIKSGAYRLKGPVRSGPTAVLFDRHGREVARFSAVHEAPQRLSGDVERYMRRALR